MLSVISRPGPGASAGDGRKGRGGGDFAGVLVELGLDIVLGRTAHVQVGRVVGVAEPAEVVGVGLARCRVCGLELGQERICARFPRSTVLTGQVQPAGLVLDGAAVVEQLVEAEVVGRLPRPLGRGR